MALFNKVGIIYKTTSTPGLIAIGGQVIQSFCNVYIHQWKQHNASSEVDLYVYILRLYDYQGPRHIVSRVYCSAWKGKRLYAQLSAEYVAYPYHTEVKAVVLASS